MPTGEFVEIPKNNLSTTNTPFTVNADGLLRVLFYTHGGAIEQFCVDDILMATHLGSSNYDVYGVGFFPIRKGTHYMKVSSNPGRCANILFFPYKNTSITTNNVIKY